jgi:hypothetical protein
MRININVFAVAEDLLDSGISVLIAPANCAFRSNSVPETFASCTKLNQRQFTVLFSCRPPAVFDWLERSISQVVRKYSGRPAGSSQVSFYSVPIRGRPSVFAVPRQNGIFGSIRAQYLNAFVILSVLGLFRRYPAIYFAKHEPIHFRKVAMKAQRRHSDSRLKADGRNQTSSATKVPNAGSFRHCTKIP